MLIAPISDSEMKYVNRMMASTRCQLPLPSLKARPSAEPTVSPSIISTCGRKTNRARMNDTANRRAAIVTRMTITISRMSAHCGRCSVAITPPTATTASASANTTTTIARYPANAMAMISRPRAMICPTLPRTAARQRRKVIGSPIIRLSPTTRDMPQIVSSRIKPETGKPAMPMIIIKTASAGTRPAAAVFSTTFE